ncbi:MAG: hypothetical protein JXB15_18225 [Anaerolineales bacterium]|nr:hypothetical protein [Anaerolineales bacterium]
MLRLLLGLLLLFSASACYPLATPLPPLPTGTPPPPADTATPTIVWFPPTATYTPLPIFTQSISATLDTRSQYGALILADDFSDPAGWMLGRLPAGNIALGVNELSLAVTQERSYLISLRQDTQLSDFYLEITASPNICRGADEYGLLFRYSSAQGYFRFGLTCSGQARVDRLIGDQVSSSIPPTSSGAIPRGAPSQSRLAIWALGKDMRFYANGAYLFSLRDGSLLAGGLGVYVRSSTADMVSANFSDLRLYEPQK